MIEPRWVAEARKHIGQKEVPGPKSNSWILNLWVKIAPWLGRADDSVVPWCGAFVAHCLRTTGIEPPKAFYRASAYLSMGKPLPKPAYGCIVVFTRDGGGHVGFVVGKNSQGNLMVLGGNQGDAVKISAFSTSRVTGYRWPQSTMIPEYYNLPLLASDGSLSTNEV